MLGKGESAPRGALLGGLGGEPIPATVEGVAAGLNRKANGAERLGLSPNPEDCVLNGFQWLGVLDDKRTGGGANLKGGGGGGAVLHVINMNAQADSASVLCA